MEYFRNDQFADGLVAVQAATIEEIRQIVPANWDEFVEADKTKQEEPADKQGNAPIVNCGTTSKE
jgi:ribosomal protein S19E (S16A)